jgi:hypothetical protein
MNPQIVPRLTNTADIFYSAAGISGGLKDWQRFQWRERETAGMQDNNKSFAATVEGKVQQRK